MSPDKFQQAWKSEGSQPQVTFNAELLSKEVEQSHEAFRSMIFRRHVVQAGMVLAMIPIWWLMGIMTSPPWTWYLTMPVLLWIAIVYLWNLKRYSQRPSESGEPLLVCVKESLAQVEHQIRLMRSLIWWNVMPAAIAMMAFFAHSTWETTQNWWGFMLISGLWAVVLCLVYGWSHRTHELSVRKELEPRRRDLQKLIMNLESDDTEGESEMRNLVSSLSVTDGWTGSYMSCGSGAENWNLIIPSWREVAIIIGPTLAGAYLGYRFPFADIAPDFPRSVIAAVFPCLIALFALSYRFYRRHQGQPLPAARTVRLKAPAIVAIILLTVFSILVFVALVVLQKEATSRLGGASNKSPTDGGYAKVAPFTGVRWENDRPIVCVKDVWSPLVSINGIPIDRIMEFANDEFGSLAHKRFAEDLVELLSKFGHEPQWTVTLGLEKEDGQVEIVRVPMTEANRDLIWQQANPPLVPSG